MITIHTYNPKDFERIDAEVTLIISAQYYDVCRGEVKGKFWTELKNGVGIEGSTIKLTPEMAEECIEMRELNTPKPTNKP